MERDGSFEVVGLVKIKDRIMNEVWFFGSFGVPLVTRRVARFILVALLMVATYVILNPSTIENPMMPWWLEIGGAGSVG